MAPLPYVYAQRASAASVAGAASGTSRLAAWLAPLGRSSIVEPRIARCALPMRLTIKRLGRLSGFGDGCGVHGGVTTCSFADRGGDMGTPPPDVAVRRMGRCGRRYPGH